MIRTAIALFCVCGAVAGGAKAEDDRFVRERAAMIDTIRAHARSGIGLDGSDRLSEPVLAAMAATKRHLFVPERRRTLAYADAPVGIDHGQTISQPFVVALMTHLAEVEADDTVLEIGTGSGYQAAILARLVRKVCTIEIVRPLGERAGNLLQELGYGNVEVRIGDGYQGWPECGPFDAVVVTAALDHVPPKLIEQLETGGRLVMPVGPMGAVQRLTVVEKIAPDRTETRAVTLVRFVPFTRAPE